MPNKLVDLYRDYLAKNGQTDDRDDSFIIEELGELAKKDAPELFDAFPDFSRDWADVREANAPSLGAETGRAFKRAGIGLGSTALGGAALLTGSDYLKRQAAALQLQASDPDLAATIPTLEDIAPGETSTAKKVFSRDALRYGLSKVGEAAPSIGEAVATGLIGGAIGSSVAPGPGTIAGAAGGALGRGIVKKAIQSLVTKELAQETIEAGLKAGVPAVVKAVTANARRIAAVRGGTAVAAVNSYILNSGEVYSENDDRPTAMALGLVSAIPDTVLPALVVRRMFPGVSLSAGRAAAKELVGKNAIKVAQAAGVVAFEGATESFQEAVNIVARNMKEGVDPFTVTEPDKIRIREAGITGMVGGGLASPAVVLGGGEEEVIVPDTKAPAKKPITVADIQPPPPPAVVSPVARVRAMPPEQQTARLAELTAIPTRTPDEEAEYQILLAVAPRVEAEVPITPPPATPPPTGEPTNEDATTTISRGNVGSAPLSNLRHGPLVESVPPHVLPSDSIPGAGAQVEGQAPFEVVAPAERVASAAFRFPDGAVEAGLSHAQIVRRIENDTRFDLGKAEIGFVTSTGRFLGEEEAMTLARAAGQLDLTEREISELTPDFGLSSELLNRKTHKLDFDEGLLVPREPPVVPVDIGERETGAPKAAREQAMLIEQQRLVDEYSAKPAATPAAIPTAAPVEAPVVVPPEAAARPIVPAIPLLPPAKPKRKWGRYGPRSDGVLDIIDAIQDEGGVPRRGTSREGGFDGWEDVFGGRMKSLVGKNKVGGWDRFMKEGIAESYPQFAHLAEIGASELGDLIQVALDQRQNLKRATAAQRVTLKFEERVLGGTSRKAGNPVNSDTLNTTTKFKSGGVQFEVSEVQPDGTVIVKDGPEYGQQVIPPGVDVFPDKRTLRRAKDSTDFLPPDDAAGGPQASSGQTSQIDSTAPLRITFRDATGDELSAKDRSDLAEFERGLNDKLKSGEQRYRLVAKEVAQETIAPEGISDIRQISAADADTGGTGRAATQQPGDGIASKEGSENTRVLRSKGGATSRDVGSGRPRQILRLRSVLEKVFGKRILFVDFGRTNTPFGLTSPELPNTVLINTQAPFPFSALVGHEFTHNLKVQRPDLYKTLADLIDRLKPMPLAYETSRRSFGYAEADFHDEYISDMVGDRFHEPEFWQEVGREAEKGGLAAKFRELVDYAREWLLGVARKLVNLNPSTARKAVTNIEQMRRAVAGTFVEFAKDAPYAEESAPAFRTSTEPTNPAVQAQRTNQFQITMGRMVSNGADVQAMSRELLVQQTGEVLEKQIADLQARLAQATTAAQRRELQQKITVRTELLADTEQMRAVTFSPYHIAIAMDDVMNASLDNLVSLLHEAAESLTMRLGVEMQGAVFRAVEKTTAEMTAKMQAAARNTGATIANAPNPGELLAETMAQKLAAEGIPESTSLAQAIVRWVKAIYYRVAMAAQRAFGAEPNPEMALAWYENQLRRELGGDYEYAFSRLLDRFLPEQNTTRAAHYTGASGTPGGIVDFLDPVTSKLRQPWVEPLSDSALDWNMRFRTAETNPGESDGIALDEANDRIAAAAYNDEIRWLETLRGELAPTMDQAEFYLAFGRGEKNPVQLLEAIEAKRAGVSEAEIGGERMTDTMNGMANNQVLQFIRGVQIKNLKTAAKIRLAVEQDEAAFTEHAQELNRLEPDMRNADLHEAELKKRAKTLVEGLMKSYKNGLKTSSKLGEMVAEEESLGKNDPLPQFYQQVFDNLLKGGVDLFEYIEAIALLDMPLGTMTPAEIWTAIREKADTSAKLRELSRNKPLALTISVMARDGARQVDQIQLRRADGETFIEIRKELEGIRNATEAQLRVMLTTIDEKNAAKGLRQRIKHEYLKERRSLKMASDRLAAAESRIELLEAAKPSVDEKVGEMEQAIGGIYSDWQPESGSEFTVMRRQEDGTFQKAIRKLAFNSDGSAVDSDGVLNDIAQNMQWLRANQERRAGQKEYQRIQQQTYALELLDVARTYQAANFGKIMGFVDAWVRPLQAIARQAGHSSGSRINAQFNKYEFINRSGAKALTNASREWNYAYKQAMKSTGIEDYGRFRYQVFNPVMFFLGVNPGFDQSQAIRAATAQAEKLLSTEPSADFSEKFERFLLATKKVNDELLTIAEQHNVLVSDPKLGGDLRHALARGWLTGMRGMNEGVVVTLIHDMEKAGWKLAFDTTGKVKKVQIVAATFGDIDADSAANPDVLREAINPYFTPGILDRWLKPFINKPGEPVFKYDGNGISQLDLQAAWAQSGGDVISWIDALGERIGVLEEGANQAQETEEDVEADIDDEGGAQDGTDHAAKFRVNMLRQIDRLFAWEAKMAYEAEQTPDLFAGQGTKMHVLMDARVNDLLPEEHVDFAMHDPQSVQQMLGQIAFHGAFGRNGQALVANWRELSGVTQAKKFAFDALPSTTVEGKRRDAAAGGFDYDDLSRAVKHADDVMELKGEIESAMGVSNIYGPLHDARASLELLGFAVGQVVDQPKTGALNFLSIGARLFAMHSMSPRVLKATALSYAELAKNSFGDFLRSFGIDLIRYSEIARETGEVEGKAFRRLPWGVVMSGDMGKDGSFQDGLRQRFVVRPLRFLRALQKKGVGPGLATIPGLGTMQRFATEGAIANNRGQVFLLQEIINNGVKYFASHPEDLANPAFRFDANNLELRADRGMYDWFRNKTVEYNMGPIESIVRGAIERQQAGERTITTEMVEQLAQMNAQELDGASSINTAPAGLMQNPVLKLALPLLRWPLWMMHAAHNGLANADGKADFKSMLRGIGRLAAWNLPLGLAFTFMIDEYDDKILGKKNAMPEVEKVGAIPVVGPALALATTERGIPREILGIGQRMIRSGNIYGLGADVLGSVITPFDPGSGQRIFSLDQRVLVMSQFLNLMQAVRNMVSQGGTATWGSVYRPLVASVGGNGMLNSLGVVNNMLGLDNQEARQNNRINAARWVNTAAKELGIETKSSAGFSNPTPMSVWTREMQLAAMANDRMGFMEAYRKAMEAAREKVSGDDRVPVADRERESAQRVLQSWRSRNPFAGLAAPPTPDEVQQMLRIMDDDGRADVQEAMRRFQDYTRFIAPSPIEQYINRRVRPPNPLNQIERMRRQAAGLMFAQ